jgi:spermidine/putrescine transport system substrate-binding protein
VELSRRGFLTGGAATVAVAAAAGAGLPRVLAARRTAEINADLLNQTLPPRPYHPITWPISSRNQPIADGLSAERDATLRIYAWADRIAAECLQKFSRKFRCQIQLTTFASTAEAIATMTAKRSRFDVFLGAPIAALGTLIGRKLIQPLNHSYIPNISQVWPRFTNPYYDEHWRYTAPYMIYTTGIGWRKDLVDADPYSMANGWALLWEAGYSGRVAVLDDYRETISLGLMKDGITAVDTADPRLIDGATQSLIDLAAAVHPRIDNNASTDLAAGTIWVRHAWSGQIAAAAKKLPPGTSPDALGYWFPPNGSGPVANDTMTVPTSARSPVLAHSFINFMLEVPNAIANARGTGFTQPLTWVKPSRLVSHGVLPASLISTVVLENDFYRGLKELQLPIGADALWQQAWHTVVNKMRLPPDP